MDPKLFDHIRDKIAEDKVTVVAGPKPHKDAEICTCKTPRPIDRGMRIYTEDPNVEPAEDDPKYHEADPNRVIACDSCNGAILYKGYLQLIKEKA